MRKSSNLIQSFIDRKNNEYIVKGDGPFLYSKKKKYLDSTSGLTGTAILGWKNRIVEESIKRQLSKFGHIDYKYFLDLNRERLANLLLSKKENKLDGIFFVGGSGGEACEASMKLSFLVHQANGKKSKKYFISRKQSYHGSGSDSLSLGDRPNLHIYKNFFPKFRSKINEHNIYRQKMHNETVNEYTERSINELEQKILQLGSKNVCAFVAETMMGGLIGDVPPTKDYWKGIRKVCDKYNIHIICDEVWCGTGVTGKIYCIDWDNITPDFIFIGKTLGAGYAPVSAIVTKKVFCDLIKKKFGAIQFSTTHQGHSLGVAAALGVQKIIHSKGFLNNVINLGDYLRSTFQKELSSELFFKNVRGRGLRNSIEYGTGNSEQDHLFGIAITEYCKDRLNLLISAKWHRICLSPAINIKLKDLNRIIEGVILGFRYVSSNWSPNFIKKIKNKVYY